MNRFGEIADELTELIEELDREDLSGMNGPLKSALERAFARACEAERRLRLSQQAVAATAPLRPRKRRHGGAAEAEGAKEVRSAVVVPLSLVWRNDRPRARG